MALGKYAWEIAMMVNKINQLIGKSQIDVQNFTIYETIYSRIQLAQLRNTREVYCYLSGYYHHLVISCNQ